MEKIKVGFALTGSYCTFSRAIPVLQELVCDETDVIPFMSENAYSTDTRFGKAADFANKMKEITGNEVIHSIKGSEAVGPMNILDVLIIAPCTGNTLAKIANGITDTSVTMAAKATIRNHNPLIIAVSTNELVIIELSRENLVKSRVLVLSSYFM